MVKLNPKFNILASKQRILGSKSPIIALTGGIASGKSSVSSFLQSKGIYIVCADSIIKDIYGQQQTLDFIKDIAPKAIWQHKINFKQLRELFFTTPKIQQQIENFLFERYPLFLQKEFKQSASQDFILYDIPLLFEKKLHTKVDHSVCVYTTPEIQIERVQQRDGCSKSVAKEIIDQQLSMEFKKDQANYTINNIMELSTLADACEEFFRQYFSTD